MMCRCDDDVEDPDDSAPLKLDKHLNPKKDVTIFVGVRGSTEDGSSSAEISQNLPERGPTCYTKRLGVCTPKRNFCNAKSQGVSGSGVVGRLPTASEWRQ